MATESAEKKLAIPGEKEWAEVKVPAINARLNDGSRISIPQHLLQVSIRYPVFEDGKLVALLTQNGVAKFLRRYNESNKTSFRYPTLFEDEAMRDQLGKDHTAFDENFRRNGKPWGWGYVADFTKPYGKQEEGISGQGLVTRLVGYRLPSGDFEVGVVTIAPSGMVPTLSRKKLEKIIKAKGLKALEKRRGKEIYEKGDKVVDVRNPLGYPQFTLEHDAKDEKGMLYPHSHHIYTPLQDSGEAAGSRDAHRFHHVNRMCFLVNLYVYPEDLSPDRSFPLVRESGVEAECVRPVTKVVL